LPSASVGPDPDPVKITKEDIGFWQLELLLSWSARARRAAPYQVGKNAAPEAQHPRPLVRDICYRQRRGYQRVKRNKILLATTKEDLPDCGRRESWRRPDLRRGELPQMEYVLGKVMGAHTLRLAELRDVVAIRRLARFRPGSRGQLYYPPRP
jgi:hypothetical protein